MRSGDSAWSADVAAQRAQLVENEWLGLLDVAELDLEAVLPPLVTRKWSITTRNRSRFMSDATTFVLTECVRGQSESCVCRRLEPVNTAFRKQPRPAEDDHRVVATSALGFTSERTPGERFGEAWPAGVET